jgi:hypothetical protein
VKHGGVGQVGITAVHLAGADDSNRRRLFFHGPDLQGRGMGS